MKISQTIVATGPDGQDLGDLVQPVEQSWGQSYDELGIMTAVAQMLAHAKDSRFTKTLAIHIEL